MHLWALRTATGSSSGTICRSTAGQRHRDMAMYTIRPVTSWLLIHRLYQYRGNVGSICLLQALSPPRTSRTLVKSWCACVCPVPISCTPSPCNAFRKAAAATRESLPCLQIKTIREELLAERCSRGLARRCARGISEYQLNRASSSAHSLTLTLSRRDGADFILDLWPGVHYQDSLVRPHQVP